MIETPALEFVIATDKQLEQQLIVDSHVARVGSGAHCEVRLPPEDAAPEQLEIEARGADVFAVARALEPAIRLNEVPFVRGRLLPDSWLRLGRVRLRVRLIERHRAAAIRPGRRRARWLAYALGGVGIPLGILVAGQESSGEVPEWNLPPELLWSADEAAVCPERELDLRSALADKLRVQGESARERAPFSPDDGVAAVELLSRAAACYAAAGAAVRAERSRTAAADLKLELERQFHIHQVRLERALIDRRYDQAKWETRTLLSFTARRKSAYVDWLATLDRQIELKFAGSTP
jgi:hypothetical protein